MKVFLYDISAPVGNVIGAIHKRCRQLRGSAVSQKRIHADAGGQWQKADILKFKILPKFSMIKLFPVCYKTAFDSRTNHLNENHWMCENRHKIEISV